MNIKTDELRRKVEGALADGRAKWEQDHAASEAQKAEHREKWVAENGPRWARAAEDIKQAANAGEPITIDMLPREPGWTSSVLTYSPVRTGVKAEYEPPRELVLLKEFLDLVTDETLSTNALKAHGLGNLNARLLKFLA